LDADKLAAYGGARRRIADEELFVDLVILAEAGDIAAKPSGTTFV
jgi:hypothetical protein